MEINCARLGNTYSIEFYGNLEDNFYSFEILLNIDTEKNMVFVEPSDYLNTFFKNKIKDINGTELKTGALDITFHRDDYRERLIMPEVKGTEVSFSLDNKIVILVDDVLYTGRTIRAALEELNSFGRAEKVQLAVLVDRGHRELPIKADFVGKNIPTHEGEHVNVLLKEIDDEESVVLIKN